jgi:hypothetical protein
MRVASSAALNCITVQNKKGSLQSTLMGHNALDLSINYMGFGFKVFRLFTEPDRHLSDGLWANIGLQATVT